MDNLTILVNTCDKYEDAWFPFFKLFQINWPQSSRCEILLNTETKDFNCDFLDVKVIKTGVGISWSKRLKCALNSIGTDYVLFFLEDFFLQSPVNQEMFEEALTLMKNNSDIGYIGLKYAPDRIFKEGISKPKERFFSRDILATKFRITAMSVLWRKDWLLELINENEDPWEFERNASIRSRKYEMKVLEINNYNNICPPVFDFEDRIRFGYGITQGQWLPRNKELFEKFGIDVNFDNLGINYKLYEDANSSTKIIKPKRSRNLIEVLYEIKKKLLG